MAVSLSNSPSYRVHLIIPIPSLNHAQIPLTPLILKHPLRAPLPHRRRVPRRQALEAARVRGRRVRDPARHDGPRLVVEVVGRVAVLVVVYVVRHARRAAKHFEFLLRLDALGAARDAARCDARVEEGPVVGASVELDLGVVDVRDVGEVVAKGRVSWLFLLHDGIGEVEFTYANSASASAEPGGPVRLKAEPSPS